MQTGKNFIRTGRALTASVLLVPACDGPRHEAPQSTNAGTDTNISAETSSDKAAQDRALRILKENANFEKGPPGNRSGDATKDF